MREIHWAIFEKRSGLQIILQIPKKIFEFGDKNDNLETAPFLENGSKDFSHFFTRGSPQYDLSKSEDHFTPKILHIFKKNSR